MQGLGHYPSLLLPLAKRYAVPFGQIVFMVTLARIAPNQRAAPRLKGIMPDMRL